MMDGWKDCAKFIRDPDPIARRCIQCWEKIVGFLSSCDSDVWVMGYFMGETLDYYGLYFLVWARVMKND